MAVRRHWICIAEPWVTVFASLLLVAWLTFDVASPRTTLPLDILWWLWFALVARALWTTFDHQRTWFVATDRRLLMVYGFIIRRVAMMPLAKVTDMSYHRSPLGWVLGYGTFVLESAGQDQALHEIDHVPHPDPAYRAIVSEIFHKDVDDAVPSVGDSGEYVRDEDERQSWDDDPTDRLSFERDQSSRWDQRLRNARERAASGVDHGADRLRARQPRYPQAHPDPGVGARHTVRDPGQNHAQRDGDATATDGVRGAKATDDVRGATAMDEVRGLLIYRAGYEAGRDERRARDSHKAHRAAADTQGAGPRPDPAPRPAPSDRRSEPPEPRPQVIPGEVISRRDNDRQGAGRRPPTPAPPAETGQPVDEPSGAQPGRTVEKTPPARDTHPEDRLDPLRDATGYWG